MAGTVGNAALINALADRAPVLVLARDVSWGQRISAEDVQPVSLPAAVGRYAVSESERAQVIGRTAAENLHAGQLLGRRDTTRQAVPGPGQRVIGVRLEIGRFPARGLIADDSVAVRPAPRSFGTGSPGEESSSPGAEFFARVVRVSPPDADGAITADLLIADSTAATAVAAAIQGAQVSLLGPAQH
ncbi:SAF domain-containing protein [Saccharopolyspora rosea]|uniref:SAF domain-containing protein n=1 Tax=Saccharopolyspora rosea TaxID=524884 RepID=UPI0021D8561C|nr:SAF domain-containing protein [Saccharopolyspora rosea]